LKKAAGVGPASLAEGVREGDARAIARAISLIEDNDPEAARLIGELFPYTGRALLVGLTGSPGTGKSSLVNHLARHYRAQGKKVGIIAIDPTSPFTGGALLGDRVRMQEHATDENIYIRSMATRGSLGGLARATGDAVLVLDAAGKDLILIETVGVGQDEIDIVRLADVTVLLLVPGLGDDVQNFKAGVMEIADVFVINKVDRGEGERVERELKAMLSLSRAMRSMPQPSMAGWRYERKATMPLNTCPARAARNGAGTDTRPLRSTLLMKVERNNTTLTPSTLECSPASPLRGVPPPMARTVPLWESMG